VSIEGSWTPAGPDGQFSNVVQKNMVRKLQSGKGEPTKDERAYAQNFQISATALAEKTLKSGSCGGLKSKAEAGRSA
jgi:hypothetical protein